MTSPEIEKLKQENEFLKQELNRIRHAHNELKRNREKKKLENSLFDISKEGLGKFLDLFKEFIRSANSNPVVGAVSSLIITDILYRLKIIDLGTAIGVNILVGTVEGGNLAGEIIQDITDLTQLFGKRPSNLEFSPSARTIVYAESSSPDSMIKALLTREGADQ